MTAGPFDLSGKVAIVTGGNGGIGLGMARGLAAAGAAIAIVGRNETKSAEAVAGLMKDGHKAIAVAADVTDETTVAAMVTRVRGELGRIDILINNAGINIRNRRRRWRRRNGTASSRPTSPAPSCARAPSIPQ
jgi:2-deoxy-D-gluconate 3-dehydrogenase